MSKPTPLLQAVSDLLADADNRPGAYIYADLNGIRSALAEVQRVQETTSDLLEALENFLTLAPNCECETCQQGHAAVAKAKGETQ